MCFSPEASFSTGAVLVTVGTFAIRESKFSAKLPFALIPIFFGIQQFSEGILWLALQRPGMEGWRQNSTFFFLVFAQVVWPFWVTFSMYMLEKKSKNRNILKGFTILGFLFSTYMLYRIIEFPVNAVIDCRHIYYSFDFPKFPATLITILYLVFTILPPFISTVKRTNFLGLVIVISLLVSEVFYTQYLISVWCFFAAILSVIVLYVLRNMRLESQIKA